MSIESPERLDLHQEGQRPTELTLVAGEEAVRTAEAVVSRLWEALSAEERERARSVRDAIKVLLIVSIANPEFETWLATAREMLEPWVSGKPDAWWDSNLRVDVPRSTPIEAAPSRPRSRAERRAELVDRIREANAETLERLADL